jgi:hypothetical protein
MFIPIRVTWRSYPDIKCVLLSRLGLRWSRRRGRVILWILWNCPTQFGQVSIPMVSVSASFSGVLTQFGPTGNGLARRNLAAIPMNEDYLVHCDSALFVIVLDDHIPKNMPMMRPPNMLHGSYELKRTNNDDSYLTYQVGSCFWNRWCTNAIIVCGIPKGGQFPGAFSI